MRLRGTKVVSATVHLIRWLGPGNGVVPVLTPAVLKLGTAVQVLMSSTKGLSSDIHVLVAAIQGTVAAVQGTVAAVQGTVAAMDIGSLITVAKSSTARCVPASVIAIIHRRFAYVAVSSCPA